MEPLHEIPSGQVHTIFLTLTNSGKREALVTLHPQGIKLVIPKKSVIQIGPIAMDGPACLCLERVKRAADVQVMGAVTRNDMITLRPFD